MIPIAVPCKGPNCSAKIFWLTLNGKLHPFDDLERKRSHFATCVDSQKFRRPTVPKVKEPSDADPS